MPTGEVRNCGRASRNFSHPYHQFRPLVGESHNEPLRILYCGSDDFSCAILQALHKEYQSPSSNIASIDVVCREGKPYGRGLKLIRHPQIKQVASSLGLPVHQIKTFTGWEPPEYLNKAPSKINLVVAVSFGLLIPPRILSGARFSGINLHPSMLPEYKGPAPLHWTILNGEKKTGMSLQTLHPTSFDEGIILDQTPWPGIDIPEGCDYSGLLNIMQHLGVDMFLKAIRNRLYLPPYKDAGWAKNVADGKRVHKHAPKIKTAHKLLCFEAMDSSRITRMSRAFGPTWAFAAVPTRTSELKRSRIIFPRPFKILSPSSGSKDGKNDVLGIPPGLPFRPKRAANAEKDGADHSLLVNTIDGKTISMNSIKVEGSVEMPAYQAAQKYRLIGHSRHMNTNGVITFHECLTAQP